MKLLRLFDEATYARLTQLSKSSGSNHPRLTEIQRQELSALLGESGATAAPAEFTQRVNLGDRVRLVAPHDPGDWYELELVLPSEADVDADRISLFTPVGIALLGRKCGDRIAWEVPAGMREMIIESVDKLVTTEH